ncbi:MAG: hypothetical protein HY778_15745 [Betaproteobacteria bacterium]|nr:hypothetical protein [Betaproteobacteria bacterium]
MDQSAAYALPLKPFHLPVSDTGFPQEMLAVDPRGVIRTCSTQLELLFGYDGARLRGQHICVLIPELAGVGPLVGDVLNPLFAFACRSGRALAARRRNGQTVVCELQLLRLTLSGECRGVVLGVRKPAPPGADQTPFPPPGRGGAL